MYAKLEGFKRKHGHCDVWHKFQDKALVVWVQNQRGARRRNSMPLRRIEALDRIGFLWGAPGRTTPDLLRDDSEEEEGDGRQEERVGRVTRSSPKKASSSLEFGGTLDSSAKDYIGSGDDLSEEEKVTALAMLDLARADLVSDPTPPKVTETDGKFVWSESAMPVCASLTTDVI